MEGEKKVETILVGGLLVLFSVLILPVFVLYGYLVRVICQVSEGQTETPPVFEEYEELLVDGLKVFVVTFVYSLASFVVVTLALAILIIPAPFNAGPGDTSLNVLGLLLALFISLLALFGSLAVAYLLPAAIAAFARTDRLGSAFSPSELRAIGTHREYAVAWVVAVGVTILASLLAGVVSVTVVGALLVPFVSFFGPVAAAYAIGEAVAELQTDLKRESISASEGSTA